MPEKTSGGTSRTESFILAARRRGKRLILNADFLDDERLGENERAGVLSQVFARDVRAAEIEALSEHLAPVLDDRPLGHGLICGPTGCGKTITVLHTLDILKGVADREGIPFEWFYVDCLGRTSCFAALNRTAMALEVCRSYSKGVPTDWMMGRIRDSLRAFSGVCLFVLDEIDNVATDKDFLMSFLIKSLPRQVSVKLNYLFLTNDVSWDRSLDARTMSCMRKTDLLFSPYNAAEIAQILRLRVEKALDGEQVDSGAISLIAALASRDSGDARKAVELLAKSAMIAERRSERLTPSIVYEAQHLIEEDNVLGLAARLPLQQQITLHACLSLLLKSGKRVQSRDVYDRYAKVAEAAGVHPLSQRRVSDALSSLDLYSLVSARLVSHGRYGQSRVLELPYSRELASRVMTQLERILGSRV